MTDALPSDYNLYGLAVLLDLREGVSAFALFVCKYGADGEGV